MPQREALVQQLPAEASQSARAAAASGSRSVICEPMWHCRPTSSTPPLARAAQDLGGQGDVDAELGLPQARRDVGVRPRVDVGVDPERHPGDRAARRRRGADPRDLVLALRVPLADPVLEPERDLGVGLAHPGEDDPLGREARPAARATSSPPETMSAPAPSDASRRRIAPLPLALTA